MARFDVGLESVPTTTIGRAPAIVDTSSLAVTQLAGAFIGQYLKEKEQNASSRLMAGLQTDILKIGQAVERGERTLSQGNVMARQLTIEAITANPALSEGISELYTKTSKSAGLSAGKSEAQLRQEQFLEVRKDLADKGWLTANATEQEVSNQLKALQKYNQGVTELQDQQRQLTFTQGREELDANRKRAINEQIKDNARTSIRKVVNAQADRVRFHVNKWNQELTDGNRQQIFEQANALRSEILSSIPPREQLFLSDEEVSGMVGILLEPLDILKDRADKNMTAKWAQDRIDTTVALSTEDALRDPGVKKLSTWSRLVGEATLARLATNVTYARYMGPLLDGKGGKGTEGVPAEVSNSAVKSIIDAASTAPFNQQDKEIINEGLQNSISGILKDIVTDEAQGRINKPSDVEIGMKLLSDPAVSQKIVSGEIVLDANAKERGKRVLQEEYINKLVPTTRSLLSEPLKGDLKGKTLGDLFSLEKENGVLTAKIKPEAVSARAEELKQANPGVALFNPEALAEKEIRAFGKTKDLNTLVTNMNRAARVMATLNSTDNVDPILDTLVIGTLGGTPEEEAEPVANPKTQNLLEELGPDAKERFNSLSEENKQAILAMSPKQIQQLVSLLAP